MSVSALPDPQLSWSEHRPGRDITVLAIEGELDLATAPQAEALLLPRLTGTGPLVLDLSGLTFLGAAGLNLLLRARLLATRQGIELRLVARSRAVLRVLELAREAGWPPVVAYPEVADALADAA
ncbi:anti-sigma factor antagonist [Amycolatopsis sp.]|uniref:anti-sigma factor antagonist n=1 Tax=Amycolatopsis sp. TaxID=37632 RepID=UPI002C96D12D|nr:anti-sigma factor antagonist [Amycolatopsis sp.]HVV09476.1 anti-sigma factor antagonist [Amycolatopsis sp.]